MKTKFYPGWRMTVPQHDGYFRLLQQVYAALGLTTRPDQEAQRQVIHQRAFHRPGVSAKDIDHMKGYDAFKATCLAILQPSDVEAQLAIQNMPRTRLVYAIRQLADEAYLVALAASERFKCSDWPAMPLDQMEEFRQTAADRMVGEHRATTKAHRSANRAQRVATPDPRLKFPDLAAPQPAAAGSAICPVPSAIPVPETEDVPF
jgi:hypothetical protein